MSQEEQDYNLGVSLVGWGTMGIGYGANAMMKTGPGVGPQSGNKAFVIGEGIQAEKIIV